MTMEKIDPNCLCGRPHPCPNHGAWVHTPPHQIRMAPDDHITVGQRRQRDQQHQHTEQTQWALMKEIADYDRRHNTPDRQEGAA